MENNNDLLNMDRRVFIKGLGLVSVGLVLGITTGGCERIAESIKNRPTRRRLRTGSTEVDADIETYREAVERMKALPSFDPRSWANQASIHGTISGGFNQCQHGTNHFFSWHRAYLNYFEKICQELTGNSNFGLPYWNWNQDPIIHSAYQNTSSALFEPRNTNDLSGVWSISDEALNTIFGDSNFFTFSTQIEGTPHNTVHSVLGQTMVTGGSPLDPIFWNHHCMVDYCWAKWNIEMENDNTNDTAWIETEWDHFVDGKGNPASITAGLTTLLPLLSYQYEPSAIGDSGDTFGVASDEDFKILEKRVREGANVKMNIKERLPLSNRDSISLLTPFSSEKNISDASFSRILNRTNIEENVFVSVKYAELPPTNDFFVRVYINMPNANAESSIHDIHFAGSFAFFGTNKISNEFHKSGHRHHEPNFLVNITPTLKRLRENQLLADNDSISVQLVPVAIKGRTLDRDLSKLILNELEIIVTPITIDSKK